MSRSVKLAYAADPFGVTETLSHSFAAVSGIDGGMYRFVGKRLGERDLSLNTAMATAPVFAEQTGADNPFSGIERESFSAPTLADIDGDGDLDMALGDRNGIVSYYLNTGTATAPAYVVQTGTANPFGGVDTGFISDPTFADIDGDGRLDLVVGEYSGTLQYFRNTGTASTPAYAALTGTANPFDGIDVESSSAPAFADIDGDRDLDMVVGDIDRVLNYYENTGTATAPIYTVRTGAANPFDGLAVEIRSKPTFVDIDGDGLLDLVVGGAGDGVRYFLNTGTATAPAFERQTGTANPFDSINVGINSYPAFADIDGDGDKDLVLGKAAGSLNYYRNETPANEAPTTTPVTLGPIAEDSGALLITQTMLLANAQDVDTPLANLTVSGLQHVGNGYLAYNGNSTWSYTPAPNDYTEVSFSYTISDGKDTVGGTASLDIEPVNDAPVAAPDSAQTSMNTGVNVSVLGNDTDIDGGALRVVNVTPGSNGSAAIRADQVSVRYTPNAGFSGFDNFSYTVSDGVGGTATANVRVLVASLSSGSGNDVPLGTQQADFVLAQDGSDRVLSYGGDDYVDGGRGADTLVGGDGADTLLGGEGPDTFIATSAELAGDQIDGGEGTDTLVITNAPASLPANFSFSNLEQISFPGGLMVQHTALLDLSSLTLAPGSSNSITGGTANSRITGTASADNIVDSAGNDDLRGAGGNDTIMGGFGQDTLHGGTGNDVLYGGNATTGNDFVRDIFVFNTPLNATTNVDQIIGFQANNQDRIQLDTSIFSAITGGATLGLDADEFRSVGGGNAVDGNDFILLDPLTGNLFYDADGSGLGAKVLFATLVGLNGTLDVTDFVVSGSPV